MIILGFDDARVAALYPAAVATAADFRGGSVPRNAPLFVDLPLPDAVVAVPGRTTVINLKVRVRTAPNPARKEFDLPTPIRVHGPAVAAAKTLLATDSVAFAKSTSTYMTVFNAGKQPLRFPRGHVLFRIATAEAGADTVGAAFVVGLAHGSPEFAAAFEQREDPFPETVG